MRKMYALLLWISLVFLYGCESSEIQEYSSPQEFETFYRLNTESQSFTWDEHEILLQAIHTNECRNEEGYFIDYALLGTGTDENHHQIYYLLTKGQQYEVMSGVLVSKSWFSDIPTKIVFESTENGMTLLSYDTSLEGSLYVTSIQAMFPEDIFKIWRNDEWNYTNPQSFLDRAETFFQIKVIPEENQHFPCSFCDKIWYEKEDDQEVVDDEDVPHVSIRADLTTTPQQEGKSYYFRSDGTFWTKGRRGAWSGTWKFGVHDREAIVEMEKIDHVYHRYTMLESGDNTLKMDLNIVQK